MTGRDCGTRSVLVLSDETLIAETVRAALATHGFAPLADDEPGAEVGLLIRALTTSEEIGEAARLIKSSDFPWAVVTSTPAGPGWGAAFAAGASVVVDSSTSIARVAGLLEALLTGTHDGDPEAERDLRRQWEEFASSCQEPETST